MQLLPLLACRLRIVAGDAKALPVVHVIPRHSVLTDDGSVDDRRDVVSMGLVLVGTDATAGPALPRVSSQNREPPRLVAAVAVSALVSVGAVRVGPLC